MTSPPPLRPSFLRSQSPATEGSIPDPDADPRNIVCCSLAQLSQGAPWRVGLLHDRPQNLFIWVTRGQGRVIINGVRRGVGTHNALFLPAGTLFSCDLGSQGYAQVIQSPLGLTGKLPKEPLHLRVRDSLAQAEIMAEIESMQRELRNDRPLVQDALRAHLGLVAVWLRRQLEAGHADSPRLTAAQRLVRKFSALVVTEFRRRHAMAEYAEALGVTPTHLTRVCREVCGRTAADVLTERRVHEARALLARPGPTAQVISQELGFASPAYFTRFMQNNTGLTPSALRKQSLERRGLG